jgi:hypothetical protein
VKSYRVLGTCVAVVLATIMAAASSAVADRRMVVLIDASGSMTTPRNNSDGRGANRFEAAKSLAGGRVSEQAGVDTTLRVAVYTFRGSATLLPHTSGFVDYNLALDEIEALNSATDVGGSTPLAGAMCEAVDVLAATDATTQILQVSSDGQENSTPLGTPCQGTVFTGTVTDPSQYPADSYQARVLNYITNTSSVIVKVDLFQSSQITFTPGPDQEGISFPGVRSLITATSATAGLNPLENFFTFLTQATGGQLIIANDEEQLPVSGDLNDDRCVDRADAILVARAFGPIAPPKDGRFDLTLDRTVDFADYQLQASRITASCGPDPYVPRAPIVCDGPQQLVIDGHAIESGGVTIEVRSACKIVIKNSLIVSGQNAITIIGSAVVKVDNSILVGQNALLGTRGTIILSAANTIFHGLLRTNGALSYINRGGNIFE